MKALFPSERARKIKKIKRNKVCYSQTEMINIDIHMLSLQKHDFKEKDAHGKRCRYLEEKKKKSQHGSSVGC